MKHNALLFGMTLDEFWYSNPQDFYIYADVFEEKNNYEMQKLNYMAWGNGFYDLLAMQQAFSNKNRRIYPTKPFSDEKEKEKNSKSLQQRIMEGAERFNLFLKAQK